MKVRYSDTAATELEEISDNIAQFNRLAARDVLARVERTVGNLAEFPERPTSRECAGCPSVAFL